MNLYWQQKDTFLIWLEHGIWDLMIQIQLMPWRLFETCILRNSSLTTSNALATLKVHVSFGLTGFMFLSVFKHNVLHLENKYIPVICCIFHWDKWMISINMQYEYELKYVKHMTVFFFNPLFFFSSYKGWSLLLSFHQHTFLYYSKKTHQI